MGTGVACNVTTQDDGLEQVMISIKHITHAHTRILAIPTLMGFEQ